MRLLKEVTASHIFFSCVDLLRNMDTRDNGGVLEDVSLFVRVHSTEYR